MAGCDGWDIFDPNACIERPAAEIHVLEPHGIKGFVHPPKALPNVAADHHEGAGGLLHGAGLLEISLQVPVVPVDRIGLPQAIEAK
jgi:hypothetical protein